MYLIVPLTKSAWKRGRIGPTQKQDWYRALIRTKVLQSEFGPSRVAIITNCQSNGDEHEMDNYRPACEELKLQNVDFVYEGYDTVEQITIARGRASANGQDLIIISTFLHYLRVRWLCRGLEVRHFVAFGFPRPIEAITDSVLSVAYPILEFLGLSDWFVGKTRERHKKGQYF